MDFAKITASATSFMIRRALVASRLHVPIAFLDLPRNPTRVLVRGPAREGEPYEPERFRAGLIRRAAVPDWEIWTACRP